MRIGIVVLAALLAGCGLNDVPANSADLADAGESFPVKGDYHRTSDRTVGGQLQRMETDGPLDASTRDSFEQLVAGADIASCGDRTVDIGGGSFSVRTTCDGGSYGEYTLVKQGTYSKDSRDITHERTAQGATVVETVSYRLNG